MPSDSNDFNVTEIKLLFPCTLLQDVSIGFEFSLKMIKHVMYMRKDV